MLLLAVVCGGASLIMARAWLEGQTEVRLAAIEVAAPAVSFSTLVVAAEPLRFGTPLTAKALKTIPWPEDELPEGAFRSIQDLVAGEPRTVLFPVEASEPILAGKLTGPGERAGLSRLIAEGHRAVTIRVNDVAGVAGFVLPGDRVDVVLTVQAKSTTTTDVLLQNVKVLSIDQIADERTSEPVVAKAVTVEVDPPGAQKISLAQTLGSLSLSLRGSGDVLPAEVATVTPADITGLGAASAEAPVVALPVAISAPAEPVDTAVSVSVTRALVATEYRVPARDAADAPSVAAPLHPPGDPSVPLLPPGDQAVTDPAPSRFLAVPKPAPAEAKRPRPVTASVATPRQSVAALAGNGEDATGSIGSEHPAGGGHIIDLPTQ
ncbi:MAG TPA: Flp pilus assembly protein CpaB [Methylomirabilota bacterium]|nr:Flp pilus assembly protein CpaB [Methylomirabilota bacterium]